MEWGRIVVPVAGWTGDARVLAAGVRVAQSFDAELVAAFAPPDPTELTPWLGEGFVGGVQASALESLKEAASEGERAAREALEATPYAKTRFVTLNTPVWRCMAVECRLADLVIFGDDAARGRGPFADTFEQVLMEERAAVMVARGPDEPFGPVVVAWDGSEPASRAARRAAPLLRRAHSVIVAGSPAPDQPCAIEQLGKYYATRGIRSVTRTLEREGDAADEILDIARAAGAGLIVSGAFGHSRLREFVFGGVTRTFLHSDGPALFLAH